MSLDQYKSLFVTLENIDHVHLNDSDRGQEVFFSVSVGNKSLKSATAFLPKDSSDTPVAFDSILTFPFDYSSDKEIAVQLKDKNQGNMLGAHLLKVSLLENRDCSLSARMKLKSVSGATVGYLNARITLSNTGVQRASAARFVRTENASQNLSASTDGIPEVVPLFDESRHSTRSIQCSVYQLEDPKFDAKSVVCEVSLDSQDLVAPPVGKSLLNGTQVYSINKTFVFPFAGETFLKFKLYSDSKDLIGSGAIALGNFVTKRQNVVAGALGIESANGNCLGKLFFRLERFQSSKKADVTDELEFGSLVTHVSTSMASSVELRSS